MKKTELVSIVQKSGLFSLYQDNPKEFEYFANLVAARFAAIAAKDAAKKMRDKCVQTCITLSRHRAETEEFDAEDAALDCAEQIRAIPVEYTR